MPLRVVCPSCSSQLSVRDEFAGRAVRCPKCGGVIPPDSTPDSPSPPPAEQPAPSPEQLDAAFQNFGSPPESPAEPTVAPARPKAEPVRGDRDRDRPRPRPRSSSPSGRRRSSRTG